MPGNVRQVNKIYHCQHEYQNHSIEQKSWFQSDLMSHVKSYTEQY